MRLLKCVNTKSKTLNSYIFELKLIGLDRHFELTEALVIHIAERFYETTNKLYILHNVEKVIGTNKIIFNMTLIAR